MLHFCFTRFDIQSKRAAHRLLPQVIAGILPLVARKTTSLE